MSRVVEKMRRSPSAVEVENERLPTVARWFATRCLHIGQWANVYQANPVGCRELEQGDYILKLAGNHEGQAAASEFARSRLVRESLVASEVSNSHIVPILAGDLAADAPWIVQPFCGADTLRAFIEQGTSLPHMLWLVRQTCEALAALHEVGWLHGDVCPENVAVSEEGHATLIDLGFARRLKTAECDVRTAPFSGRLTYAAPESFSGEGELTTTADLYSIGVLLFELLTGSEPFANYSADATIAAKKLLAPPDVRQFHAELPFSLANLTTRLLAREPLRRPGAREVVEQLVALEVETFLLWR